MNPAFGSSSAFFAQVLWSARDEFPLRAVFKFCLKVHHSPLAKRAKKSYDIT